MLDNLQNTIAPYLAYLGENLALQALAIVLVAWVIATVIDLIVALIGRISNRSEANKDQQLIRLIRRPVYFSILLIGVASASSVLTIPDRLQTLLFSMLNSLALIFWSLFLIKLAKSALRKLSASSTKCLWLHAKTLPLFENLAYVVILVLAIYYVFSAWNVDMTAWLASAGIVGIAVGFAAKDTLANLFSGVFILADAPYKIGDFVVLDSGERGEITKIGLRSTRMLTRDDIEVTVPNSVMGNTKIINESGGPHEKCRIRLKVGVAYGTDIDKAREILEAISVAEDLVCGEPQPRVRLRQFGASGLNFELLCWIDQPVLQGRILDQLHSTVYKQFLAEGIEIPYAKQDLYIKELPQQTRAD